MASGWVRVDGWSGAGIGSRVKAVIGEETFVGLYFGVDDDDARDVSHRVTSDAAGDLSFGGYSPEADELYVLAPVAVEPWDSDEDADVEYGVAGAEPQVDID